MGANSLYLQQPTKNQQFAINQNSLWYLLFLNQEIFCNYECMGTIELTAMSLMYGSIRRENIVDKFNTRGDTDMT